MQCNVQLYKLLIMSVCFFCSAAIKRKPSISCATCKKQAHPSCITDTVDLFQLLSNIKGLSWKCIDCSENCISMNPAAIVKMLDEKVESVLSTVNEKIAAIKSDIAMTAKVCPESRSLSLGIPTFLKITPSLPLSFSPKI